MSNYQSIQFTSSSADRMEDGHYQPEMVRVINGGQRLEIRDGVAVTATAAKQAVSTIEFSQPREGDWRTTARESSGFPTTRITPKTLVSIDGFGESTVQTFLTMGVLREVTPGVYERVGGESSASQSQPQHNLDDASSDLAIEPPAVTEAVNQALEPFADSVVEQGAHLAIAHLVGNLDEDTLVSTVARASGVDPVEARSRVAFVIDAEQAKADFYLKRNGIGAEDLDNFYEYCRMQKGLLKDALTEQVFSKRMTGWKALIQSYKVGRH